MAKNEEVATEAAGILHLRKYILRKWDTEIFEK